MVAGRRAMGAIGRRRVLGLCLAAAALPLSGCGDDAKWHGLDIAGAMPSLAFAMMRASDGKAVTAADYRGKVVLLYFGYTFCPDICPATLANVAAVLKRLGPAAAHVRVLFVTVDPDRDTPAVLKAYVAGFAPQIVGLRGTANQLAALARRYRVAYSVAPAANGQPYEVTHSSAVYVFDAGGAARLLVSSLGPGTPDIAGTAADLRRLVDEANPPGLLTRLMRMV